MDQRFTTWRSVLRDFLHACEESLPDQQANRIREASALANFAGSVAPHRVDPVVDGMLSAGAYESAAIALLTPGSGFILSRGTNGVCLASVVLLDEEKESTAVGKTLALAILQAHAKALLAESPL